MTCIDQCIGVTARLLTAKVGKEREDALANFLVVANQLTGHPSKKKQGWGVAMMALGVALVGAAIALTVCVFMGPAAWPCFALFLPAVCESSGPLAIGLACAINVLCAHIGYLMTASSLVTIGGIYGSVSIYQGTNLLKEGRGNKQSAGSKMSDLHGAFFTSTAGSHDATDVNLFAEENVAHAANAALTNE